MAVRGAEPFIGFVRLAVGVGLAAIGTLDLSRVSIQVLIQEARAMAGTWVPMRGGFGLSKKLVPKRSEVIAGIEDLLKCWQVRCIPWGAHKLLGQLQALIGR